MDGCDSIGLHLMRMFDERRDVLAAVPEADLILLTFLRIATVS